MPNRPRKIILALALILFFCECVSAENNTTAPPDQPAGEITYQIGDFTITQGQAIGVLIFVIVMIVVIAMAMKPIRR